MSYYIHKINILYTEYSVRTGVKGLVGWGMLIRMTGPIRAFYGNSTKDVTRGTTTVAPRGESISKFYRLSMGSGNS